MNDTELRERSRFMNGYRDPVAEAERKARALAEAEFFGEVWGGGAGNSGSGERECGFRKEGGVYAEVPMSANGKPLEHFIVCPPIPIDRDEYRLHPKGLGVSLIEVPEDCLTCGGSGQVTITDETGIFPLETSCVPCGGLGKVGVTHVFDIVGENNYPNVADFLEEARRLGVSRRLELSTGDESVDPTDTTKIVPAINPYSKLSSRSKLILLHKRAVIENALDFNVDTYYKVGETAIERLRLAGCPKHRETHLIEPITEGTDGGYTLPSNPPACAALWWHDLDAGDGETLSERIHERCGDCKGEGAVYSREVFTEDVADTSTPCAPCDGIGTLADTADVGLYVERKLASGSYRGYALPEGFKPEYRLGIFAIFPLIKLALIAGEDGEYDEDRYDEISAAGLPQSPTVEDF